MSEYDEVYKLNTELAEQIQGEIDRNPNSPYAGKWIGIAKGQVVIVSEDTDEIFARLAEIEPEPLLRFIVEGASISQYDWIEFEGEGEWRE
jgi:hypothetical protein